MDPLIIKLKTMKKTFTLLTLVSISFALQAQKLYSTKTGQVKFNASSPLEQIIAVNNQVDSKMIDKTGQIVFSLLVKSFKFERELMQEHFNENYMESDKFPRSEFKGNITNMNEVNFAKDGAYKTNVAGKLTMHGVTKDITVPGTITVTGNTLKASANFTIKLQDYGITVPGMVADKVAKEAAIKLESDLKKQ